MTGEVSNGNGTQKALGDHDAQLRGLTGWVTKIDSKVDALGLNLTEVRFKQESQSDKISELKQILQSVDEKITKRREQEWERAEAARTRSYDRWLSVAIRFAPWIITSIVTGALVYFGVK